MAEDSQQIAPYRVFRDPSFWAVIGGNIFAIAMAITEDWTYGSLLWTYWAQSVIIGSINAYRMYSLKEFSMDGVTSNGRPLKETRAEQLSMVWFFIFHYGFFHLGYFVFLLTDMPIAAMTETTIATMVLTMGALAGAHIYSYRHNSLLDFRDRKPNLGTLMFYPYMRVIPMHLIIAFGFASEGTGILIFMAMKTLADAGMHAVEHRIFQKAHPFGT